MSNTSDNTSDANEDYVCLWFRHGSSGVDLRRVASISPDRSRKFVSIQLRGGGFVNFPTGDPDSLAMRMNDAKATADGVKVVS